MTDVSVARVRETALATVAVVRDRNLTFVAGAIAYAAFVSLVPLLVLVFALAAAIRGPGAADAVVATLQGFLSPNAADLLRNALASKTGAFGTSLFGVALLAWSALKVFRGLNTAFAVVYGTEDAGFVDAVRDGAVALACLAVAAVALVGIGVALALVVDQLLLDLLGPVLLLGGLTVAFSPLYYVLPDTETTLREALPGAFVAAAGWLGLGVGFRAYVAYAGANQAYGVLGGVMLLLTWLYVAALVLLVGAVVNAVLAGRLADDGETAVGDDDDD
ncbi:YihY/virulence factor BrkB family protein [Halarchaeum sp. CBA1220]|uniref:YihY/virulence factor BrkB family protein n=1 Tax=Halarchaeum sp. CBA1220 TaxID=1853682 RepID=UPI000F3A8BB8|nr:YihY/virulence factor BrkB family protein [Halarchaeum sp. CBA1220]QLC33255.1 YihY/virulence factor BrkB family protein [Halarchaeum sp. CBA1220]